MTAHPQTRSKAQRGKADAQMSIWTSKNIKAVGKAEELVMVIKRSMDSKDTTLVSEDTMMIPEKGGLLEEKNVSENDAGVSVKKKKKKEKKDTKIVIDEENMITLCDNSTKAVVRS